MKNNMERIKAESEDFLKCPFCGGEAEMCSRSDIEGKYWYIRCKNCSSRGSGYYESLSVLKENEEFFCDTKSVGKCNRSVE